MAETSGLLIRRTFNWVPRVRIPPCPPLSHSFFTNSHAALFKMPRTSMLIAVFIQALKIEYFCFLAILYPRLYQLVAPAL